MNKSQLFCCALLAAAAVAYVQADEDAVDLSSVCSGLTDVRIPYPGSCNKYITCCQGQAHDQICKDCQNRPVCDYGMSNLQAGFIVTCVEGAANFLYRFYTNSFSMPKQ